MNSNDEVDDQLDRQLRAWGSWARSTAPQFDLDTMPSARASKYRRGSWPVIAAAALVVAVASLTAVAPQLFSHPSSHQVSGATTSSAQYPATFDGTLTAPNGLASVGIALTAPPAGAQAETGVSWQQALDTCRTSGALCFPDLTAHVYLADFTKADAQPIPRLAWIIDYPRATCVPFGHPPALSSTALPTSLPATSYSCRIVNIIDSQSGTLLWSVRQPTP